MGEPENKMHGQHHLITTVHTLYTCHECHFSQKVPLLALSTRYRPCQHDQIDHKYVHKF